MQIVSGKVIFGRTVQPAQYESKKAEVEISFVLAEGEPLGDSLDIAGLMAKVKVLELVGLKPGSNQPAAAAAAGLKAVEAAVEEPAKDPPKPKVRQAPGQKEAAAAAMNARDASAKQTTAGQAEKQSPSESSASHKASDPDDALFDDAPAAPITDNDLMKAASAANARLQGTHQGAAPQMIKALRDKFVSPPGRVSDIPQEKRAEFLRQLEALA